MSRPRRTPISSGRWPYKPMTTWRKLTAVVGLVAFTMLVTATLVALVAASAAVAALVLEALIG